MSETQTNEGDAQLRSDTRERARDESPTGRHGIFNGVPKKEDIKQSLQDIKISQDGKDGPEGGFDSTPIPKPAAGSIGYTIKITFHRATDLAIGDAHVMSSDPYVLAQLNTWLPKRHKEDPNLRFRTPTIRKTTQPEWNEEWIIANVPSSGFKLKVRVYDEDPDHDDILGKLHLNVPYLSEGWAGIKNQPYQLRMRDSSKRALSIRAVARTLRIVDQLRGEIYISVELLGRTEEDGQNGRAYTVGPCRWIRHYSPLLGRIAKTKEPSEKGQRSEATDCPVDKQIKRYDFQANEMQLPGPVPAQLYHRFVEFKPWVKRMFTTSGVSGVVLGKALHHQHTRVYNFDRSTVWGHFPQDSSADLTKKFLELVHYDQGSRIFTYVLTLDALWRFTETGKEFGIDMLSKHTMHSDVSIYIAYSGEFFIRRLKHRDRPPPPDPTEGTSQQNPPNHQANEIEHEPQDDPSTDPSRYELVIDNDSGTYRPNADMLPLLAKYLSECLPGLHILTLDCQADAEKMAKMKGEQRERKKREGDQIVYTQDDNSSISSSEHSRFDEVEAGLDGEGYDEHGRLHVSVGGGSGKEHGHLDTIAKDVRKLQKEKVDKLQRIYTPEGRDVISGGSQE